MEREEQLPLIFEDGPRNGETDAAPQLVPVIGTGQDGGVYQRTDEERDGHRVYRWQVLTEAETQAIVRGDLRANQRPGP
jgi:hypothetical protein